MYKIKNKELPANLLKHFSQVGDNKGYKLRNVDEFSIKYVRTKQRSQCLSFYGVKLYNSLPSSLTSLKHWRLFKKKYTVFLIKTYT